MTTAKIARILANLFGADLNNVKARRRLAALSGAHVSVLAEVTRECQYGREMPVTAARFRAKDRRASQRERDLALKRARRAEAM